MFESFFIIRKRSNKIFILSFDFKKSFASPPEFFNQKEPIEKSALYIYIFFFVKSF